MKENRLQYEIVVWFSQTYTHLRGHLFTVNNNTYNVKDAATKRAMGLFKGVSDLVFIVPKCGKIVGIEVKAPNSKHNVYHIKSQFDWGQTVINSGGFYIMSSNSNIIKNFIKSLILGYTDEAMSIMNRENNNVISQFNKKTVIF